jgi:hypothetical protein
MEVYDFRFEKNSSIGLSRTIEARRVRRWSRRAVDALQALRLAGIRRATPVPNGARMAQRPSKFFTNVRKASRQGHDPPLSRKCPLMTFQDPRPTVAREVVRDVHGAEPNHGSTSVVEGVQPRPATRRGRGRDKSVRIRDQRLAFAVRYIPADQVDLRRVRTSSAAGGPATGERRRSSEVAARCGRRGVATVSSPRGHSIRARCRSTG